MKTIKYYGREIMLNDEQRKDYNSFSLRQNLVAGGCVCLSLLFSGLDIYSDFNGRSVIGSIPLTLFSVYRSSSSKEYITHFFRKILAERNGEE